MRYWPTRHSGLGLLALGPVTAVRYCLAAILLTHRIERLADFANLGLVGAVGNLRFGVPDAWPSSGASHVAGFNSANDNTRFYCRSLFSAIDLGYRLIHVDNRWDGQKLLWGQRFVACGGTRVIIPLVVSVCVD